MENRVDGYFPSRRLVKDFVRETTDRCASDVGHRYWIHQWIALNLVNTGFEAAQEIFTKARFAELVPPVSFGYVVIGLGGENNSFDHVRLERARCLTCSQE